MNRTMKIAVASSGLGHVARGIEAWAQDLGQALVDRGLAPVIYKGAGSPQAEHECVIGCWTRESPEAHRLLARLPTFLGWRLGMGSGYGVEQTSFAWNLLKALRRDDVEVLHVQDPQVALLMQRARSLGLIKARTILAHGTEESVAFQRQIVYLQHLAPWHLEEARRAGAWRPTWTAIPNFIDTARFAPGRCDSLRQELAIPADAMVVLCAAAIKRHHKRVDYLFQEFHTLLREQPDLPLWLVIAGGWEHETDELVAQGRQLLGDSVRFLVRFPRERMPDLYRAADLFVLASLKEMMPIALLEATASGLPCLVHEHPVMEWMVGAGGRTADMSAPGGLAAGVLELARDARRRGELGRAARTHCHAQFGREAVVDQIVSYYQQVHRGEPRPAWAAC